VKCSFKEEGTRPDFLKRN
jgi:hypothetical protein